MATQGGLTRIASDVYTLQLHAGDVDSLSNQEFPAPSTNKNHLESSRTSAHATTTLPAPFRLIRAPSASQSDTGLTELTLRKEFELLKHILRSPSALPFTALSAIVCTYLSRSPRPVWKWSISWELQDDASLLIGANRHGSGQWAAIVADQELGLSTKVSLDSSDCVPNETVLQRRLNYLLSLLVEVPRPYSDLPSLQQRHYLSYYWTETAQQAGAASLTFINEVDDEVLPPDLGFFRYLESSFDE